MNNNRKLPSKRFYLFFTRRTSASVCMFKKKKGSITIEAALAVPIFLLAVVSLLYLFELMGIQTAVRSGLQYAGKNLAQEACVTSVLIPSEIEKDVVEEIGADRLNSSMIVGGSSGISCSKSVLSPVTGIGKLTAVYKVKLPIPVFSVSPATYTITMKIKVWNGYKKNVLSDDDDEIVYITETGAVYHKDYNCTYLDLSIHGVNASDLASKRNDSGAIYHACEYCHPAASGTVYITNDGNRYHSSVNCSGLKRTIYAVPKSEAIGKGACSRCAR